MKKFVYIAIYWYLKTFKGLNISDLYKKTIKYVRNFLKIKTYQRHINKNLTTMVT